MASFETATSREGDTGMTDWSPGDRRRIGAADEVDITTVKGDGSPRRYVPIWIVLVGDDLYVRSWRGHEGAWFRHARRELEGRIRIGDDERAVRFEVPEDSVHAGIDDAYRSKYGRYGNAYVGPMVGPDAKGATLRLLPL
jgi:hypothetical protein